jgi:pyrroline-5-carboxylate reductase
MRIGFIGVGEIASAIVTGLARSEDAPQMVLSPRGAATARELADEFDGVRVAGSNQEVAEGVDVLLLTLRPDQREALRDLRVPDGVVVVSALAGVALAELQDLLRTSGPVVRAIPMPATRRRAGTTAVFPTHPVVEALFDRLGGTLAVPDEHALSVLSAVSGALTGYLQYLTVIGEWAAAQGLPAEEADAYVRGVFVQLSAAVGEPGRSLGRLVTDHETPGGLNEQLRTRWFDDANRESLVAELDALLRRVEG